MYKIKTRELSNQIRFGGTLYSNIRCYGKIYQTEKSLLKLQVPNRMSFFSLIYSLLMPIFMPSLLEGAGWQRVLNASR